MITRPMIPNLVGYSYATGSQQMINMTVNPANGTNFAQGYEIYNGILREYAIHILKGTKILSVVNAPNNIKLYVTGYMTNQQSGEKNPHGVLENDVKFGYSKFSGGDFAEYYMGADGTPTGTSGLLTVAEKQEYKITKELTLVPVVPANAKVTPDYIKPVTIPAGTIVDGVESDEVSPCQIPPCPTHKVLSFTFNGKDFRTAADYEKVVAATPQTPYSSSKHLFAALIVLGIAGFGVWYVLKGGGAKYVK